MGFPGIILELHIQQPPFHQQKCGIVYNYAGMYTYIYALYIEGELGFDEDLPNTIWGESSKIVLQCMIQFHLGDKK